MGLEVPRPLSRYVRILLTTSVLRHMREHMKFLHMANILESRFWDKQVGLQVLSLFNHVTFDKMFDVFQTQLLTCKIGINPVLKITWKKNAREMLPAASKRCHSQFSFILHIADCTVFFS